MADSQEIRQQELARLLLQTPSSVWQTGLGWYMMGIKR